MSTGIIIAMIGAVPALVTAIVSVALNNRVISVKIDEMERRMNIKLENSEEQFDRLEKKVEKHNNVVERIAVLERDNKTAFNRIDELRVDLKHIQV